MFVENVLEPKNGNNQRQQKLDAWTLGNRQKPDIYLARTDLDLQEGGIVCLLKIVSNKPSRIQREPLMTVLFPLSSLKMRPVMNRNGPGSSFCVVVNVRCWGSLRYPTQIALKSFLLLGCLTRVISGLGVMVSSEILSGS